MTSTLLSDGRAWRLPATPFVIDDAGSIVPPAPLDLLAVVPLVKDGDLLPFVRRLVGASHKRRHQPRWSRVNQARLQLAFLCIERALAEQGGR